MRVVTHAGPALASITGVTTTRLTIDSAMVHEDARLRGLVLGYLDDHPTAMDTLDGIAEWWILRQQIEIEVRRVSAVLATLVAEGVLEECEQGGVRFFRRLPAQRGVVSTSGEGA